MDRIIELLKPYDIPGLTKIRLGKWHDGGYVAPLELIGETDTVVSSEYGGDISFEYDFATLNPYCRVVNYDDDVVDAHIDCSRFEFIKARVGGTNSIKSIIEGRGDVTLKIDIEGGEYEVFNPDGKSFTDLSHVLALVIELHNITRNEKARAVSLLENIEKQMTLVHIHENAFGGICDIDGHKVPNTVELTFVNNRFADGRVPSSSAYPIQGLDVCNKVGGTDTPLTFIGTNMR